MIADDSTLGGMREPVALKQAGWRSVPKNSVTTAACQAAAALWHLLLLCARPVAWLSSGGSDFIFQTTRVNTPLCPFELS